jgi:hypothetical protein
MYSLAPQQLYHPVESLPEGTDQPVRARAELANIEWLLYKLIGPISVGLRDHFVASIRRKDQDWYMLIAGYFADGA